MKRRAVNVCVFAILLILFVSGMSFSQTSFRGFGFESDFVLGLALGPNGQLSAQSGTGSDFEYVSNALLEEKNGIRGVKYVATVIDHGKIEESGMNMLDIFQTALGEERLADFYILLTAKKVLLPEKPCQAVWWFAFIEKRRPR